MEHYQLPPREPRRRPGFLCLTTRGWVFTCAGVLAITLIGLSGAAYATMQWRKDAAETVTDDTLLKVASSSSDMVQNPQEQSFVEEQMTYVHQHLGNQYYDDKEWDERLQAALHVDADTERRSEISRRREHMQKRGAAAKRDLPNSEAEPQDDSDDEDDEDEDHHYVTTLAVPPTTGPPIPKKSGTRPPGPPGGGGGGGGLIPGLPEIPGLPDIPLPWFLHLPTGLLKSLKGVTDRLLSNPVVPEQFKEILALIQSLINRVLPPEKQPAAPPPPKTPKLPLPIPIVPTPPLPTSSLLVPIPTLPIPIPTIPTTVVPVPTLPIPIPIPTTSKRLGLPRPPFPPPGKGGDGDVAQDGGNVVRAAADVDAAAAGGKKKRLSKKDKAQLQAWTQQAIAQEIQEGHGGQAGSPLEDLALTKMLSAIFSKLIDVMDKLRAGEVLEAQDEEAPSF